MTDMDKIKKICIFHQNLNADEYGCSGCPFFESPNNEYYYRCMITTIPVHWNLDKIKEILNEVSK